VADTRYLKQRGHSWSFAMAVPRPLRAKIGKPIIVEALHTQALAEAQRLRWPLVERWKATFERAQTGRQLSHHEIEEAAGEVYGNLLAMAAKLQWQTEDVAEWLTTVLGEIADPETRIIDYDAVTDFSLVSSDMQAITKRAGVTLEPGPDTHRLLGRALLRAHVEGLENVLARLRGQTFEHPVTFLGAEGIHPTTGRPIAETVPPVVHRPAMVKGAAGGIRFKDAAERFLAQRQHDPKAALREGTRVQHETIFRLFADYADNPPLATVTRTTAADFLETVAKLSPTWGQQKGIRDMSLQELLQRFPAKDGGLSARSINRYADTLAAVWRWADRTGRFEGRNPFEGQHRKAVNEGAVPFTVAELNKLFAQAPPDDATRWLPRIALFSGMRLNEIAQLRATDISEEAAVAFFHVREGDAQSVKTEAGVRRVPIHSELVEAGLLGYVASRKGREGNLWGLRPGGPDNKPGHNFSNTFNRYRRSIGVDRPRVAFHSFRKTFVTCLDNAGVPSHDIAAVVGHARGFTLNVYSGGKGLALLRDIVEKAQWPGLVLSG
jgi:integrase